MNPFSWRIKSPLLLAPCLYQKENICWAIAFTRQFEALLKLDEQLTFDQHLSIQELVNVLPTEYRSTDGTLYGSFYVKRSLECDGTVLDDVCPLTESLDTHGPTTESPDVKRYKVKTMKTWYLVDFEDSELGSDEFENSLLELLEKSPVAVRIPLCGSYDEAVQKAGGIYDLSPDEIESAPNGHYLLLTGHDIDANGIIYWECQDSGGIQWGDNGFVLVRRKHNLLTEFIEMEV